jgi:pimeloyl-ACP methyl ester carboxylesterase
LQQETRRGGFFVVRLLASAALLFVSANSHSQDYERERRWADQILPTLMVGNAEWLEQKNGHRFLGLFIDVKNAKGAVIVAHGRGWSPDFELYGTLRTRLAEAGYTTLSIQLPVLPSTAIIGLYAPLYPDARERFQLAVDFLKAKGYRNIAIVSHSLGATMANQYLIRTEDDGVKAWVMIGIINGLEEMFRIKIPVLDVFGGEDWNVVMWGADERRKQILANPGSAQVVVPGAKHFFEDREDELVRTIAKFLNTIFNAKP